MLQFRVSVNGGLHAISNSVGKEYSEWRAVAWATGAKRTRKIVELELRLYDRTCSTPAICLPHRDSELFRFTVGNKICVFCSRSSLEEEDEYQRLSISTLPSPSSTRSHFVPTHFPSDLPTIHKRQISLLFSRIVTHDFSFRLHEKALYWISGIFLLITHTRRPKKTLLLPVIGSEEYPHYNQ